MSWIKENYHIAALGGGILVLAGLGYTSYASAQETKEGFVIGGSSKKDVTTVDGGAILGGVTKSLAEVTELKPQHNAADRPLNLFTSVDLFTKGGNNEELKDLLTMAEEVHVGIPNKWWVDNMLDPSWSDSPQRDEDGDGFTNGEEFQVKTDPNDSKSHGALIEKLKIAEVKSAMWLLEFNSVLGDGFQFNFKYRAPGGDLEENRMAAGDAIAPGDLFFKADAGAERFKLLNIEEQEMKTPTGVKLVPFAVVEDQLENKKGKQYKLQFGMRAAELNKTIKFDHTVVFYLDAIGESGNKFEVVENGVFSLPHGGEEKIYKLSEVKLDANDKPASVIVTWELNGKPGSREIPVK